MISQWNAATSAKDMFQLYMGLASPTPPAGFWLALSPDSANPGGTWTELAVANYARQEITWDDHNIYAVNDDQIDFTNLGAGTVLGQAIFDSGSTGSGDLLFWSDLDTELGFATGHSISYLPGVIRVGVKI